MDKIVKQVLAENPLVSYDGCVVAGYKKGYLKALESYAWWKDGVQYVGCGVKTLKQAIDDFNKGDI